MRRGSIRGRRGALTGATAAVVCLGGVLAACGSSGGGDGYVAVGAAGATPDRTPGRTVAPTGDVELVPLDGAASDPPGPSESGTGSSEGGGGSSGDTGAGAGAEARTGTGSGTAEASGPDGSGQPSTGAGGSGGSGSGSSGSGSSGSGGGATTTPSAPGTGTPSGPAALKVGDPERKAADKRWCEDVTLDMVNTGGAAVRSGTVTFGTHIIGALGIDWATVESTQDLPVPIGAGKRKKKTWTVCVDAWRVPLGMHVETRDVSVKWK
ncbi:hypothetical protein [Streptomyces sp. NPDC055105]|uniref:hypothetical protein n=1 Tax=Streptomyces sp. NPDC055105 TaxID=3365719 RepID=UPI0037D0C62E